MINEKVLEEMALMITRQTELTLEEAKDNLKDNNYNYMEVIKKAIGIEKKNVKNKKTINQTIYKEIRTLMDDGSKNYRKKQEYTEKKQEYIEEMQECISKVKINNYIKEEDEEEKEE
jgi:hypothetical protein